MAARTKKKADVIKAYKDKNDGKIHRVGDVVELTAKRLEELSKGGYVKIQPTPPKAE